MKKSSYLLLVFCLVFTAVQAQYAPQAGVAGSTAIHKGSGLFTGWATGCTIIRGWLDINDPSQGYVTSGDSSLAVGIANNFLVSLGDSGIAILTFSHPIYNGPGPDFAIFENGFPDPMDPEKAFLELAFVEVSSDGANYVRFPASTFTPTSPQIPMAGVYMDARKINNFAGKYIANYGTPFDLQELEGKPGLDINHITHIRLVDAIGSVGTHACYDSDGNIINEPYPTPIPTGGFDLDAVGAFYQEGLFPIGVTDATKASAVGFYPNPVVSRLYLSADNRDNITAVLTDVTGKALQEVLFSGKTELNMDEYRQGIYYLTFSDTKGNKWVERITKL